MQHRRKLCLKWSLHTITMVSLKTVEGWTLEISHIKRQEECLTVVAGSDFGVMIQNIM